MRWPYTVGGAVAFVGFGFLVAALDGSRAWAASPSGRSWTRRVGVLAVLVGGVAAAVFPRAPRRGVLLYFAAGVLAFVAGSLAAAGAAGATERRNPESFPAGLRAVWRAAATEYRVTRYGLVVAGVAFLLAALTGGVAVGEPLSTVGAVAEGGLLAVVVGLGAVGALVPGGGRGNDSKSRGDGDGAAGGSGGDASR